MINIFDHYWIIAGSTTDVYSSATNTMVPVADPAYVAWATNNTASPIASVAELAVAVQANGSQLPAWLFTATDTFIQPTPTTYTKGQLAAYSASARYNRASGGVVVTSLGGAVPFLSDPVSRNSINSAFDYLSQKSVGTTIQWKLSDGTFVTLNSAQITTLMNDVAGFVQSCFGVESSTVANINGGTVTSLAQIDAAFAAIANVFP